MLSKSISDLSEVESNLEATLERVSGQVKLTLASLL